MTKPSASLHNTSFSAAATKGWAWCHHFVPRKQRTAKKTSSKDRQPSKVLKSLEGALEGPFKGFYPSKVSWRSPFSSFQKLLLKVVRMCCTEVSLNASLNLSLRLLSRQRKKLICLFLIHCCFNCFGHWMTFCLFLLIRLRPLRICLADWRATYPGPFGKLPSKKSFCLIRVASIALAVERNLLPVFVD